MKKITSLSQLVAISAIAMFSTSCSLMKQDNFAQAKYCKFGHHAPVVLFNKPVKEPRKKIAVAAAQDKPVLEEVPIQSHTIIQPQASNGREQNMSLKAERKQTKTVYTANSNVTKVSNDYSTGTYIAPENNEGIQSTAANNSSINTAVLILLAIILSPLAVYLYDNAATSRFWVVLILWLLGVGIGLEVPFAFVLWLVAVIYAVVIVTGSGSRS